MTVGQTLSERFCETLFAERCDVIPSVWAEENIYLDEPEVRGRFNFYSRQYLVDCVNDVASEEFTDFVYMFGTGVGKTTTFMAQAMFEMVFSPSRTLWVFPASDGPGGSSSFVKTRLEPCLRATPYTRERMPKGASRHDVTGSSIRMMGTVLDFVGSNSPSQVAANRCSRVRQDEVDKFFTGSEKEPAASYNADRRTDGVEGSKRFKASTPTIDTGLIYTEFSKTNQERRFLPCPHCAQFLLLAWSNKFSCFKPLGCEAFVKWDASAKRTDGTWNYEQVEKSAHYICPHCKGKILDSHKIDMDKIGEWRPTSTGFPKHRGRHLPSMYSSSSECRVGALAVEFLKSDFTETGIKGFINSRLAEVDTKQQLTDKTEIRISTETTQIGSQVWIPYCSVDHQQNWPYFWFVARRWLQSPIGPERTAEQQNEFNANMSTEQKKILERFNAKTDQEKKLVQQIQRSDRWEIVIAIFNGSDRQKFLFDFSQASAAGNSISETISNYLLASGIKLGRAGDSEALEIGWCDTWEELDDIQSRNGVANQNMIIDARWGSMDNSEVFAECFKRCPKDGFNYYNPGTKTSYNSHVIGSRPFAVFSWTPILGWPKAKRWRNKAGIPLPYQMAIDDPFKGKSEANRFFLYAFNFDAQWALSELSRIRKRNSWGISNDCKFTPGESDLAGGTMKLEEYNRHLRGKYFDSKTGLWEKTGSGGAGSRRHPDHLFDCEKNMVAFATYNGIFQYSRDTK